MSRTPWGTLLVLLPGPFVVVLDVTVLVLALPTIQRDLGASPGELQLVLATYQVTFGAAVLLGGRLGDLYGRRRMLVIGLLLFGATSLVGGLASTVLVLILARAVQGVAGALIIPQDAAYIRVHFPPDVRARALGLLGSVAAAAGVAGPVVGGLLMVLGSGDGGWRLPLLVNVPVCLLTVALLLARVRDSPPEGKRSLDVAGAVLAAAGMTVLVVPVALAGSRSAGPLWLLLLPAAVLLALFVVVERRRGDRALLHPDLLADRFFRYSGVLVLLLFAGVGAYSLTYAYFLQTALGFGPLHAALLMAPSPLGSIIGALWSARVARWWAGRGLPLGLVLLAAMVAGMAVLVVAVPVQWLPYVLTPVVFGAGLSLGLVTPGLLAVVLDRVAPHRAGSASGAISTVQQVARALGVAAVGSLFFAVAGRLGGGEDALTTAYALTLVVLIALFGLAAAVLLRLVATTPAGGGAEAARLQEV